MKSSRSWMKTKFHKNNKMLAHSLMTTPWNNRNNVSDIYNEDVNFITYSKKKKISQPKCSRVEMLVKMFNTLPSLPMHKVLFQTTLVENSKLYRLN